MLIEVGRFVKEPTTRAAERDRPSWRGAGSPGRVSAPAAS